MNNLSGLDGGVEKVMYKRDSNRKHRTMLIRPVKELWQVLLTRDMKRSMLQIIPDIIICRRRQSAVIPAGGITGGSSRTWLSGKQTVVCV